MATYQTTPTSQVPNNEKEQVQAVRETLQHAVANRGRQYAHHHTFTFRFQDDDTRADRDSQKFQSMLRVLNLPAAEEVVLSSKMVAWDFRPVIDRLTKKLDVEEDRKFLMFHYAGHAKLNDSGDLCLVPSLNSKAFLDFAREFGILWSAEVVLDRVDVVIILDCCYSAASARGPIQADRTVEIVSSVGMSQQALGNPSTVARMQNRTFTSRLADEVARTVGNPDKTSVSFSEIVAKMRGTSRPERVPEYAVKLGGPSIRLPISRTRSQAGTSSSGRSHGHSRSSSSISATPDSDVMAIFRVRLGDADSSGDEVSRLVEWIHSLHPSIGLELTGVYRGRSTDLIFHAPWALWSMLDGLDGWELVCETFGRNRLGQLAREKKPLAENIPPQIAPHLRRGPGPGPGPSDQSGKGRMW